MFFTLGWIDFNNIRAHVGIFREYSSLTCQQSRTSRMRSWYQKLVSWIGATSKQCLQAPPPFSSRPPGYAWLASLAYFLFRPAPRELLLRLVNERSSGIVTIDPQGNHILVSSCMRLLQKRGNRKLSCAIISPVSYTHLTLPTSDLV